MTEVGVTEDGTTQNGGLNNTGTVFRISINAPLQITGEHLAYRSNYMDLDPVYRDSYGDPLLRMTIESRYTGSRSM